MFKSQTLGKYGNFLFSWLLILAGILFSPCKSVQAHPEKISQVIHPMSVMTSFQRLTAIYDPDSHLSQRDFQADPLASAYPVPWNWIMETQQQLSNTNGVSIRYYRSPSLVSPDGRYAAYTRIQMEVASELWRSRVTSTMFIENLETGELKVIRAESPLAQHLLELGDEEEISGTMSILIPVSWSENGDRLLARQLEGMFSTSDVSDYAVVWDRERDRAITISPSQSDYTTSILLGWDKGSTEQVLFRAGILGEEDWSVWSVALNGQTFLAQASESITYGQLVTRSWTGNQILR